MRCYCLFWILREFIVDYVKCVNREFYYCCYEIFSLFYIIKYIVDDIIK